MPRAGSPPRAATPPPTRAVLAAVLAGVLPLAAGGLYLWQGAPLLSGGSASENAAASEPRPAEREADMATLVARLAERMEERPDDIRGWRLLGRSLASLGRYDEAARAYGRATALLPADADLRSLRAAALTRRERRDGHARGRTGFSPPRSGSIPGRPRAGFYLGLAALQKGDRDGALARWRALEAASPEDAEWLPMLRRRIASLAPGPTREDVEAARQMAPEERGGDDPRHGREPRPPAGGGADDAEGWARLARSYRVLGEAEKERDALRQAGEAAHRTGDNAAARRHWSRLRGLLPEGSPERAGIARRIDALR